MFIAEARSLGIPARFIIGFSLPEGTPEGAVAGYHCWAEFHDEAAGWLPIDASEAHKHPEKAEQLFAGLGRAPHCLYDRKRRRPAGVFRRSPQLQHLSLRRDRWPGARAGCEAVQFQRSMTGGERSRREQEPGSRGQ
ncbi:MAG: transglutaminase domain-containing protein [Candidatus Eisenbacteria sp.]|nr:transglutaminase domain-containing protein [Candidatus Eisenbacteria bacterium]